MRGRTTVIMPSFSTSSLDLDGRGDHNYHEVNVPSVSGSSRSRNSAEVNVSNFGQSEPLHFTRSVARRLRESGEIDFSRCINYTGGHEQLIAVRRNPQEFRRKNSNPSSGNLPVIAQNTTNRNLHLDNENSNGLTVVLLLPQQRVRTVDMDYQPCRSNRISVGSSIWKVLINTFIICLVGYGVWYANDRLRLMETAMCEMKGQMGKIKPVVKHEDHCKRSADMCDKNDKIKTVIKQALEQYNADKTGKTDFALETAGGSIVAIVDTVPYETQARTIFGISICSGTNNARALIQANVSPGQCWAFSGSKGSVIIQLLGPVFIDGVSLEHIPKNISPTGEIDTAPKDFTVWGLPNGRPEDGEQLGKFTYNANGETLQHFPIDFADRSFPFIQFSVLSNYGNPTFTCVYRLRVHGTLDTSEE